MSTIFNPYNPNKWEVDITIPTIQEYDIAINYFRSKHKSVKFIEKRI
jgi:hypothetical protein